jgi:hypothetical protein
MKQRSRRLVYDEEDAAPRAGTVAVGREAGPPGVVGERRSDNERQKPCGEAEPVVVHVRDSTPALNVRQSGEREL